MRKTNVWYCSYAESKKNTTNDFIYKTDTDTRTQHTDTAPRGATRPGESHTRTRGHTQTDRQRALAVQRGQPQSAPDDKTTGESLELCA